jgi:SSS family transporter
MQISTWDWIVIIGYLIFMVALAVYLSRGQSSEEDYYLGGNDIGFFPIAISTMATQCSTNSILGAPAFVAFTLGGGLIWLQYEIALPIAMIFTMMLLLPYYRRLKLISVYGYVEKRFGVETRILLSLVFQFLRSFATGVTIYGIAVVISYCLGVSFFLSVSLLSIFTIIYDSIGGMKGVIYSDVIQMFILYACIFIVAAIALNMIGGVGELSKLVDPARITAIDFNGHGLGDGKDFAFWPMFFGGLFLYISYYGCDQTQVQRELSSKSIDDTNMSLFINGILRFPLVLTYCFLGICIAAYAMKDPSFVESLPKTDAGTPNYNMSVPIFVFKEFPVGAIGLFMVGLFSAAMSSLDSTINSLSATSIDDILKKTKYYNKEKELFYSKLLTVFWGVVCTIFSFFVENISDSIIVSINKIGSLINGPILGVFLLGILTKKANQKGTLSGFLAGFLFNLFLWISFPEISWLWWNLFGFLVTFGLGYGISLLFPKEQPNLDLLVYSKESVAGFKFERNWPRYYGVLIIYSILITGILCLF